MATGYSFLHRHILGIEQFSREDISHILATADSFKEISARPIKKVPTLRGHTIINLFFEPSTRTRLSFEIAAKRMSADTFNIAASTSSTTKGETLIDTARNISAMHPDIIIIRHSYSGAPHLLSRYVKAAVINAGDGAHEHPSQGLLDLMTVLEHKGRLDGLKIAIIGDIAHSRVARSNILLLQKMENRVRLIGPATLMPSQIDALGVEVYHDMREGLSGCDVVMMLRLQRERMDGGFIPSVREYYHRYGLDAEKLAFARPDAIVMHPGPMNRGVEIDGTIADDINRSVIQEQVEMGVAVRMACMDLLARNLRAERGAKASEMMA